MLTIIDQVRQEINLRYSENFTEDVILDGKIHRYGDKLNLWITGNTWDFKGKEYAQITYGHWKHGTESHTVKSWSAKEETKGFKDSFKKHTEETQAKLKLEKMEKQKACKEKWNPIFKKAKSEDHPYLKYKGIEKHNSKVMNGDTLLIPAYNINGFVGVQRIFENPKNGNFEKRFSTGIEIKGAVSPLKSFKDSPLCYVTEGFATGATIQELFPEIPVIVCFSAGNICPAIETIRQINPKIKIIIAADNDMGSKTGERMAQKAVKMFPACIYRMPKFKIQNSSWSDFNDLAQYESKESVIEQLSVAMDEFTNIIPLGYLGNNYYYTSTSNQQIVPISASNHNKNSFLHMANISYWYKAYGVKDPDGNYIGVDWTKATSELMEKCRQAGLFNPDGIRGRGIWLEGDIPVINNGPDVYPNLKDFKHHYQKSAKIDFGYDRPATDEDMFHLLSLFKNLKYKNQKDYFYLAAWYIQANIFSCLDWRFHLWITGDRGAGKSTVLKWVKSLLVNAELTNNTTAAGIRQKLEFDAFPFICDEAEPNTDKTEQLVELARQMSSNGEFQTLRGTVSGQALKFNTQTCFLFGSIQVPNFNAADSSRIFVVEMASTKDQTQEERKDIYARVDAFQQVKTSVFGRCFENITQVRKNIELAKAYLLSKKVESRIADQLSAAIACYYLYIDEDDITEDSLECICREFSLLKSDYTEANTTKDSEDCLSQLLEVQVDRDGRTVSTCINTLNVCKKVSTKEQEDTLPEIIRMLGIHGLRYYRETGELFIAAKSAALISKMKKYPAYYEVLKRDTSITTRVRDTQLIKDLNPKPVKGIRVIL
jgi:putative DNA primase/helicase